MHSLILAGVLLASSITTQARPQAAADAQATCRSPSTLSASGPPDPTCWKTLDVDTWLEAFAAKENCLDIPQGKGAWSDCLVFLAAPAETRNSVNCVGANDGPLNCPGPSAYMVQNFGAELWYAAYAVSFLFEYMTRLAIFLGQAPGSDTPSQALAGITEGSVPNLNAGSIATFLDGATPWAADTQLHTLDKNVAEVLTELGKSPNSYGGLLGLQAIWKDMLSNPGTAHFSGLAADGGLLHTISVIFATCIIAQSPPADTSPAAIARCMDSKTFTNPRGPDPTCWNTLQMDQRMINWSLELIGRFDNLYTYFRKTETERNATLSAPEIVQFLNGTTPWSNDTALATVDRRIAQVMENRTDTDGILAMNQTSDYIFSYFGSGHFLRLAADGALLNIFPSQPAAANGLG
ncbi:MAG: hypothetical protein Q9168_004772 [Polycauliona sp. 1 TL-2023]